MPASWERAEVLLDAVREWFLRRRRKLATAGVVVLALWVAFNAVFGANGWLVYQQKRAEFRKVQAEVEELQKESEQLQQRIKGLKTDPAVIEREAREQLRYARPGETVYVLPGRKAPDPPGSAKK